MKVQFIEENGERKFAVVPMAEFERILEDLEMLEDIRAYNEAKASHDEYFPIEIMNRLLEDENSVKVFREYRGLSLGELAGAAGVDRAEVEAAETDLRAVTPEVLERIATALRLEVDDLTVSPEAGGPG
jgi:DNA-binding XRE family transcriptional regulator